MRRLDRGLAHQCTRQRIRRYRQNACRVERGRYGREAGERLEVGAVWALVCVPVVVRLTFMARLVGLMPMVCMRSPMQSRGAYQTKEGDGQQDASKNLTQTAHAANLQSPTLTTTCDVMRRPRTASYVSGSPP